MKTLLLNCKCHHSALASIPNIFKEPNMNVTTIIICATLVLLAVVLMYGMYLIKKRKREDERSMKKDVWEMEERRRFLEFCYDMAKKMMWEKKVKSVGTSYKNSTGKKK